MNALRDKFAAEKLSLSATTEYLREVILPAFFYCAIAGIFTGLLISAYSYCAGWLFANSAKIFAFVQKNLAYTPLLFAGLVLIGFLSAYLIKKVPEVRGSGIPRTEGILRGLLTFRWLRIILGTIVGSFLSFFGGLSLGNEGPSVQLGAASAEGANALLKSKFAWRRYVSTGGAAAGMAVAFGAPITGIMFAVEEVQKQFNPLLLLSVVVTTLTATLTARLLDPILDYPEFFFDFVSSLQAVPFKDGWMLFIVAVICGLFAVAFNGLLTAKPLIKDNKYTRYIKVILAFVVSGIAGLIWIDTLGSGFGLIKKVAQMEVALNMIFAYLAIKLVLILLGYRSGATGGLFLPMLTLGALIGGLMGNMCLAMGLSQDYYLTIVMVSIAAFLGATIRTPFTAFILLLETTHSISGFTSAAVAVFVAYVVAEICMRKPLYEKLLEKEIADFNRDRPLVFSTFDKRVEFDCFAEHKYVRNVLWPSNCRIASITRGEENIVPDGKTQICEGDILHFSGDCYDPIETAAQLDALLTDQHRKKKACSVFGSGKKKHATDGDDTNAIAPAQTEATAQTETSEDNSDTLEGNACSAEECASTNEETGCGADESVKNTNDEQ